MSILIKGGTVVNADREFRADVLCEGGKIIAFGDNLQAPVEAPKSSTPAVSTSCPAESIRILTCSCPSWAR